MSTTSPLIRLTPLQPSELPLHPSLHSTNSDSTPRPDLLPFALSLLDQANNALHPTSFSLTFKSHSRKTSPPSNTQVEILTTTIPDTTISQIKWHDSGSSTSSAGNVGRTKPRDIPSEHWFARRSYHANTSSKLNPATASWNEFVFGLRDNHSKNEAEFTPTLFDARHILDWNSELESAAAEWKVSERHSSENPAQTPYTNMTLAVYEMCHEVPFPLQPRCFPVLVATANTSAKRFVAVTVPVNLSSFEGAFYSNGRNRTEGEDTVRRKQVVLGIYTALEACELIEREVDDTAAGEGVSGENETERLAKTQTSKKREEVIEWIMGTASDAKGNVPMVLQKGSMPGAIAKDVGFFLNWIHTVDDAFIKGEKKMEYTKGGETDGEGGRRRSRGASSAR